MFIGPIAAQTPSTAETQLSANGYYITGMAAIKQKQWAQALAAFEQGHMSTDSLYYGMAEYYSGQNSIDTALAFNYSIVAKGNKGLATLKYEQRYYLFSMLGLDKEANEALDSFIILQKSNAMNFIPDLAIQSSGGYDYGTNTGARAYPMPDPGKDTIVAGPQIMTSGQLSWDFPLFKKRVLTIGGTGQFDNSFLQNKFHADSLTMNAGCFGRMQNVVDDLSAEIEFRRNRTYDHNLTSTSVLSLSWYTTDKNWFLMTYGMYNREMQDFSSIISQSGRVMVMAQKTLANGNSMAATVNISGYKAPADYSEETYPLRVMYVSNVSAAHPLHYTDSTFQDTVVPKYKDNSPYFNATDSESILTRLVLPKSNISVSPSLTYSVTFPFSIMVDIDLGWNFVWYSQPYTWYNFGITNDEYINSTQINKTHCIALNHANSQYYWVKEFGNVNSTEETYSSIPITENSKQRIDNSLSLSVSFKKTYFDCLSCTANAGFERTVSTLSKDAPVEIPQWQFTLSAGASYTLKGR